MGNLLLNIIGLILMILLSEYMQYRLDEYEAYIEQLEKEVMSYGVDN